MDESDAGLLAATARGDAEAFGRFYRRHEHQVLGYAVARCSNASDVADAVGETFLAALGAASRFRDDGGDAVPWLFGIARRVLARQRRSLARRQRLIRRLETLPSLTSAEADAVDAAIDAARLAPRLGHLRYQDLDVGPECHCGLCGAGDQRACWRPASALSAGRDGLRRRSGRGPW
jgi:DNA-directed RNA polymerase specialized sigma24 family protein